MRKEITYALEIAGIVGGVYALSNLAFSLDTRQKMFARDKGECQDCGKRFRDGWLLDCSHYDHDHQNENYDAMENGRLQCLDDHLAYHVSIGDTNGAYLIRKRIAESHGGHTREWIARNVRKTG